MMYNTPAQQEIENRLDNMIGGTYTKKSLSYELDDIFGWITSIDYQKNLINIKAGKGNNKCDVDLEVKYTNDNLFTIKDTTIAFEAHKSCSYFY